MARAAQGREACHHHTRRFPCRFVVRSPSFRPRSATGERPRTGVVRCGSRGARFEFARMLRLPASPSSIFSTGRQGWRRTRLRCTRSSDSPASPAERAGRRAERRCASHPPGPEPEPSVGRVSAAAQSSTGLTCRVSACVESALRATDCPFDRRGHPALHGWNDESGEGAAREDLRRLRTPAGGCRPERRLVGAAGFSRPPRAARQCTGRR
jgi:hypothetical protein